jgi:hypothetical protein
VFYSYVVHKTTIITQSLGLCYFNKIHSVCAVHTASNLVIFRRGGFFFNQKIIRNIPQCSKQCCSRYENILRNALHRLQEGVLYILNIRRFYDTPTTIISCTRKIKLCLPVQICSKLNVAQQHCVRIPVPNFTPVGQ